MALLAMLYLEVEGPSAPTKDPWGNTRIGLSATTRINRKDFGLTWNAALETGGILVGEEVNITLDVQFIKAYYRASRATSLLSLVVVSPESAAGTALCGFAAKRKRVRLQVSDCVNHSQANRSTPLGMTGVDSVGAIFDSDVQRKRSTRLRPAFLAR